MFLVMIKLLVRENIQGVGITCGRIIITSKLTSVEVVSIKETLGACK